MECGTHSQPFPLVMVHSWVGTDMFLKNYLEGNQNLDIKVHLTGQRPLSTLKVNVKFQLK